MRRESCPSRSEPESGRSLHVQSPANPSAAARSAHRTQPETTRLSRDENRQRNPAPEPAWGKRPGWAGQGALSTENSAGGQRRGSERADSDGQSSIIRGESVVAGIRDSRLPLHCKSRKPLLAASSPPRSPSIHQASLSQNSIETAKVSGHDFSRAGRATKSSWALAPAVLFSVICNSAAAKAGI
jgi:hypothetical protein